jgi:membrane protein YqaA with SNARE-associated domain
MSILLLSITSWLAKVGEWLHSIAMNMGAPGMFFVAIADSSFLSIPEGNDILIVILSTGQSWERMAFYVAVTTLGSVTGCLLLFTVGRRGGSPFLRRKFSKKNIALAEKMYKRYGVLTVIVPSLMPPPTPFKVFVLSAGAFRLSWTRFIIAVAIGRTLRYSMWGILAVLYGSTVKNYMENNLPTVGMILFGLLVLSGVAVGVWMYRHRRQRSESEV